MSGGKTCNINNNLQVFKLVYIIQIIMLGQGERIFKSRITDIKIRLVK